MSRFVAYFIEQPLIVIMIAAALLLAGCGSVPAPEPASAPAAAPVVPISTAGEPVIPDRIEIPAIDADIPVVELGWHVKKTSEDAIFSEWDVAEYAAGWHKNSALPGERGNVVLSGHNNILGSVFRELDQMRAGDEAIVWQDGKRHVYKVDQVLIVPEKNATPEQRANNARWIGEFDEERLTLVSCWPRNNNTHRIIVVAHPDTTADDANSMADTVQAASP